MLLRRGCRASRLDADKTRPKLALRLELGILLFNGLSFSDFLDSLQNPLQSFRHSAVKWDGFRNTLDFSRVRLYDWTINAPGLILSGVGLCECTVELFEAPRVDHVECLDAQSKPLRLLLVCHWRALSQEWLVVCLRQCTVELILQKQEAKRRFFFKKQRWYCCKGAISVIVRPLALETRLIFRR